MANKAATKKGILTFEQMLAHHMRDMRPHYAGVDATPQERHFANLRYGNELAQRLYDEIKHTEPVLRNRLIANRIARVSNTAEQMGNTDYGAQCKQAAFALNLMVVA